MLTASTESLDTMTAANMPPAWKDIRPPWHRSGSVTSPWNTAGLVCTPLGYHDPSFCVIAYGPAVMATSTVAVVGVPPVEHAIANDAVAFST